MQRAGAPPVRIELATTEALFPVAVVLCRPKTLAGNKLTAAIQAASAVGNTARAILECLNCMTGGKDEESAQPETGISA
jgi:hypothetical protein